MGYAHSYDLRQDYEGFDGLTVAQQELGDRVNREAREHGKDRHDLLVEAVARGASREDAAALSEVWGGPGAGEEFQP